MEAAFHPPISSRWHHPSWWTLIQAAPWADKQEHNNPSKARVCLMGLRRWARSSEHLGKIVFSLSDNLVSVLGIEKGRSASAALNRIIKRARAYVIGGRMTWRLRHIRTEHNPADKPSRMFDPAPAKQPTAPLVKPMCGHVSANSLEQGLPRALYPRGCHQAGGRQAGGERLFWEIFSGSGSLSRSMSDACFRTLPPIDVQHGPHHDVSDERVQRVIIQSGTCTLGLHVRFGAGPGIIYATSEKLEPKSVLACSWLPSLR